LLIGSTGQVLGIARLLAESYVSLDQAPSDERQASSLTIVVGCYRI